MLLHHTFIESAKKFANKLAIHDFTTEKKITYSRALLGAILLSQYARRLEKGFVGIMIPTSAGCMLAKIGLLMSGRIPVMINYSTGAQANVRYAQKKCDFKTVITSRTLLKKIDCPHVSGMIYLEDIMAKLSALQKMRALLKSKLPCFMLKWLLNNCSENNTAVILFTSGSEKDPKAVELSHKNILANVESCSQRFHFTSEDVFLASLPLFHVFGLTTNMWVPIYHGMSLLAYANPLDFKTICQIVKQEKATFMVGTPSFFWGYLRRSEPGDFDSLRIMLCGADKCPEKLRQQFMEKHQIILYEGYGVTECSPVISTNCPEFNCPGSVGKPIEGMQVRIENYETGEECAPGEDGRILVKGDSVMKGYFHDFEQTSLHIRRGWYDTGDMGNIDKNGYLWHVGRLKRFVKIGGEMVSMVKVESVLEHLIPEDSLCCVVEIPDAMKGAKLVAVITTEIDEKHIKKQLAEKLPAIAVPKIYTVMEEFPKMGSGKIDFRKITEMTRAKLAGEPVIEQTTEVMITSSPQLATKPQGEEG